MAKSSPGRVKSRAVAKGAKRTAAALKASAAAQGVDISQDIALSPEVQGTKIAALEHALQQLVEMHKLNHDEIRKAFQMTDAHLWVIRRMSQDIISGNVLMLTKDPPSVDMEAYYDLFNANQKRLQEEYEAAQAAQAAASEEEAAASDPDGAEVFGDGALGRPSEGVANVASP